MAIEIDNTIARFSSDGGTTATTPAFNVAAGELIVICGNCDQQNDSATDNLTISDNQTPDLGWVPGPIRGATESGAGLAAAWYAESTGAITGLTVTLTAGGGLQNDSPSIKAYKCTGHDSADILGAVNEGNLTTDPQTTTAITSETPGVIFVVWTDWNQTGVPTSSDLTVSGFDTAGDISGASGYKTIASAGASVTGNMNSGATPAGNWICFEIRAAAGAAPASLPTKRRVMAGLAGR